MQFQDILSITTKEYCLIFSGTLRSGYGIAKAHFVYFEKKHPQNFSSDLKPYYNRFYVDDVYVLLSLEEHLVASKIYKVVVMLTFDLQDEMKNNT